MRGKKREFSKLILAAVMVVYFITFGFGIYVVANAPEQLGELLAFVGAPTAVATAEPFDPTKWTATTVMEEIA